MDPRRLRWLLGAVAFLALAANVALAAQWWRASVAHQRAAQAALNDLAGVALDRYAAAAELSFRQLGTPLLYPANRPPDQRVNARAKDLRDVLLATGFRSRDPCRCVPIARGAHFIVGLPDDPENVAVAPDGTPAPVPVWLFGVLAGLNAPGGEGPTLAFRGPARPGEPFVMATVVEASPRQPRTVYGAILPDTVLRNEIFARVFATTRLVPRVLDSTVTNDAYLSLTVLTASGQPVYASAERYPVRHTDTLTLRGARAGLRYAAVLNPAFADRLIVGGLPARPVGRITLALAVTLLALAAVGWTAWRSLELARLRTDFTSSVTHELRTPLTQMRLSAETVLLGRARDDAERRAVLEAMVAETGRLQQLVDNVLHFSRAERRMVRVEPGPVDLVPTVRETVVGFGALARQRGVTLALDAPTALEARADAPAVRQVLLNLLDNAVRFGPAGGTVRVTLARDDGRARLSVHDAGPGIPPAARRRVWRPFERLETGDTGVSGTGIGLAVVHELVTAMGGLCRIADVASGCRVDVFLSVTG